MLLTPFFNGAIRSRPFRLFKINTLRMEFHQGIKYVHRPGLFRKMMAKNEKIDCGVY
jgi:hypothetical protein